MRVRFAIVLALFIVMSCAAAELGSVGGRVVSDPAGVPLRGWTIDLFGVTNPDYRTTVNSGLDGSFNFAAVPSGKYRVMEDNLVVRYLRHMGSPDRPPLGQEVELSSGQVMTNFTVKIQVGAIVQGTVVGPDGGPVAGLRVRAQGDRLWGSGSVTLADGGFQITGLRPGKYSVVADPKWDAFEVGAPAQIGWLRTPYASTVTIGSDEVVSGIVIGMRQGPVHSIRGTVAGANSLQRYRVDLQNGRDVTTLRMVNVQSDGSFSVNGVPPGRYALDLIGPPSPGRASTVEHIEVNVTDSDISDVRLEAKASPQVTARVTGLVGGDSANVKLFLRPAVNPTAPIVFSKRDAEGVYRFEGPGSCPNVVSALGLPAGMGIRSVKFNGRAMADLVVDLSNGGGEIEVVWAGDVGAVRVS